MRVKEFSSFLPWAGMVEEGVIITKDALLLRTFKVVCKDLAYVQEGVIIQALRNIESCYRLMGEGWTLYIDFFRRKSTEIRSFFPASAPPAAKAFDSYRPQCIGEYYYNEIFITLCFYIPEKKALNQFFFESEGEGTISNNLEEFITVTDDIYNILKSVYLEVVKLNSDALLTFLHSTFSLNHPVAAPECPFYLSEYLADVKFIPDTITQINSKYVVTASANGFPANSHAGMLTALFATDLEFRFNIRFIFFSNEATKKYIKSVRTKHFGQRKDFFQFILDMALGSESQLQNTEALSLTEEASDALAITASNEIFYGYLSMSLIVMDEDYSRAKAILQTLKEICNNEGKVVMKEESLNNPIVFLGSLPGNIQFNCRKPVMATRNLTHLFPISDVWSGNYVHALFKEHYQKQQKKVEYPHMITKTGQSLFYYNRDVDGVQHGLVIGPTGAGKSIFLNTDALQFLRYPGARVVFFDKDRSSYPACKNCGGIFYDIGADGSDFFLNPFYGLEADAHVRWLSQLFIDYFRSKNISLTPDDEDQITKAVVNMKNGVEPQHRDFDVFRQIISSMNKDLSIALIPFTEGGAYAGLFKNKEDNFEDNPFIVFEMNSLMQMGNEIVRFVLSYIFYKLENTIITGSHPVSLYLDEAWLFFDHPVFAERLRNWLKTLRKKNTGVMLATQTIDDAKSSIFTTVVNACMTKILLPNHAAKDPQNFDLYKELGLSSYDLEVLVNARPHRDYYYVSPQGKQLFNLCLDQRQLNILKTAN